MEPKTPKSLPEKQLRKLLKENSEALIRHTLDVQRDRQRHHTAAAHLEQVEARAVARMLDATQKQRAAEEQRDREIGKRVAAEKKAQRADSAERDAEKTQQSRTTPVPGRTINPTVKANAARNMVTHGDR